MSEIQIEKLKKIIYTFSELANIKNQDTCNNLINHLSTMNEEDVIDYLIVTLSDFVKVGKLKIDDIFSNINIVYFAVITILTILKLVNHQILQIAILMLLTIIEFSVRSFLEIDAMTKAKYLSKDYMEKMELCTQEEKNKLLKEYESINKIGIPFVIDNLLTTALARVLIYCIVSIIW